MLFLLLQCPPGWDDTWLGGSSLFMVLSLVVALFFGAGQNTGQHAILFYWCTSRIICQHACDSARMCCSTLLPAAAAYCWCEAELPLGCPDGSSALLVDGCFLSKPMAAVLQSTSEAAVEHDGVDELQDICWGWHGTYLQRSSQPSLYWNVQAGPHILQCSLHSAAGHIFCCTIVDVSEHMSSFTPALQCHLTALVLAYYLGLYCR
jgi:hypothetical protein